MTDTTRAAERLLECLDKDAYPREEVDLRQVRIVCDAYLREHPADSDEPLTKEWLRSVGGSQDAHPAKITFYRDDAMPIGLWLVDDGWKAMLIHKQDWSSTIVRGRKTRGDLRRLSVALAIQLKEIQ